MVTVETLPTSGRSVDAHGMSALTSFPGLVALCRLTPGSSPSCPLVHLRAFAPAVSVPPRLLPRLFRARVLHRFDRRLAHHHRGARPSLLSTFPRERARAGFA